jgi:hypothetical protein
VDRFRLPDHTGDLHLALRRITKRIAGVYKWCLVISSVLFPIIEGLLINRITTLQFTPEARIPAFVSEWHLLVAVGVSHVIGVLLLLAGSNPLPQFMVEFDEQAHQIDELQKQVEESEKFSSTFQAAMTAAKASLIVIRNLERVPRPELRETLTEVLQPWIIARETIFWFNEGKALYNFGVYLIAGNGKLEVRYRVHDDRLQAQNRSWPDGRGHIGVCYSQGRTLFSRDVTEETEQQYIADASAAREEDGNYYRTMVSTPIFVDNEKRGVFIVTSSVPNQMEKPVHVPIMELVAKLLEHAMKSGVEVRRGRPKK